jgi:hypothetical protein
VALPAARSHLAREGGHAVEHGMDVGDHVAPAGAHDGAARRAQGHVQHGAVLGGVDALAREHRGAPRLEARLAEEGEQVLHGRGVDPLLAVVEVHVVRLRGHRGGAPGVAREELAKVHGPQALGVRLQQAVCGQRVERRGGVHGARRIG